MDVLLLDRVVEQREAVALLPEAKGALEPAQGARSPQPGQAALDPPHDVQGPAGLRASLVRHARATPSRQRFTRRHECSIDALLPRERETELPGALGVHAREIAAALESFATPCVFSGDFRAGRSRRARAERVSSLGACEEKVPEVADSRPARAADERASFRRVNASPLLV